MLARINKKDLAERANKMSAAAQAPPSQDLKLKAIATTTPPPPPPPPKPGGKLFLRQPLKGKERQQLSLSSSPHQIGGLPLTMLLRRANPHHMTW